MTEQTPHERVANYFLGDTNERLRFQHEFALQGFRALILLNGGAVIALLTYAGHSSGSDVAKGFAWSFAAYIAGLVTSVLAYLFAYLSQYSFANFSMLESYRLLGIKPKGEAGLEPDHVKAGNRAVAAGMGLSIVSLAAFVAGSWLAMSSLT